MAPSDLVATFLQLGLAGMFAIAFLEKFVPIVPSYVMLMLLGMTVSDPVSLLLVLLATAAGSLCGSLGWYGLGRLLGDERVEAGVARFGRYVFFPLSTYRRLAASFRRHRFMATLVGQTVPVARIYLALPAGVLKLPAASFAAAAAIGIGIWHTPFLVLGFALHGSGHDPATIGLWVSAILIGAELTLVLGVGWIQRSRMRNGRRAGDEARAGEARADEAIPALGSRLP